MNRVAIVGLLLLSGCGLHGKPKVDRVSKTATHAATPEEPGRIVAPGIVEAWGGNVELAPREAGWIAAIMVVEGARVSTGDVLARLDDDMQTASVDLANAELAEAEATLAKVQNGATGDELREARAELAAREARADEARRDATRSQNLGRERAVALAEVDRVTSTADAQIATATAAEARLATLEHGPRAEDRRAAANRVAAAKARLALARATLARRSVLAPIDGVVLRSRSHAGERYDIGGAPLFVIGDTSRLQVRLEVDEVDAFRVKMSALCTLLADDDTNAGEGSVFRIAPEMGRRGLTIESPTARADVRVREIFVATTAPLVPGERVWGYIVP